MKRLLLMIGCVSLVGVLAGCFNVKAYVDPSLRKFHYEDLRQPDERISIGVLVEFQRDGQEYLPVTEDARSTVLRVLRDSKLFLAVHSGVATSDRQLEVVINNTGGSTEGSGYVTGLTLGAAGTSTIDRYLITATYRVPGKQPVVMEYQHAIHATIGNKAGPEGLESMTIDAAFDKVVEEVVLLLLHELQEEGFL